MRFSASLIFASLFFTSLSACSYLRDVDDELDKKGCASKEVLTCEFVNVLVKVEQAESAPHQVSECRSSERGLSGLPVSFFRRGTISFGIGPIALKGTCEFANDEVSCLSSDGKYRYKFASSTETHSLFEVGGEAEKILAIVRCAIVIQAREVAETSSGGGHHHHHHHHH